MPLSFAYGAKLCRTLCRKGLSREDAEDLIQEAQLRLHVYGADVDIDNEEAFLRRTVNNLKIDRYRRLRPEIRAEVSLDHFDVQRPLAALNPSPEAQVEAQQSLSEIIRLLVDVNPRTCEIFLAHRAGYTYDEISDRLNVSHITIKRHVARGLVAVMEYFASHP
jgi:RNA polymerase sigma factor (sigma-70 family)